MAILKVKNGSQWVDIPSIIGPPGQEGSPGISPAVAINDISDGHRVTITDATGSHSFDVLNGADGQTGPAGEDGKDGVDGSPGTPGTDGTTFTPAVSAEGVISWTNDGGKTNPQPVNIKGPHGDDGTSPTVSVADISGGHRVTVTDANGTRSFDVMDGEDYVLTAADKAEIAQQAAEEVDVPVQDVQIGGVSLLSDGVANIPPTGASKNGYCRIDSSYGVNSNEYGRLYIQKADDALTKAGANQYRPIVPSNQHVSAFYALAKAAGANMASSSNPVGTYTDEAKVAIQKMLGIYEAPWELIADVTSNEDAESMVIGVDSNGLPFELIDIFVWIRFPISTTGSSSYVTARCNYKKKNGSNASSEFPTQQNFGTSTGVGYYKLDVYDDAFVTVAQKSRSVDATFNSAELRYAMLHTDLDYIYKFSLLQYNSTASLVPTGTRIQLYGKRKWQ